MSQGDRARCENTNQSNPKRRSQLSTFLYNEYITLEADMDADDVTNMFINPFYAINIEPDLAVEHEPLVSEADWVRANLKLMDEIGAQEWLERLLAVLQGAGPRNPDELAIPSDEPEDI
jgi:hypothetical protein